MEIGYDHTNPFGTGVYKGLCATDPANYVCNDKLVGVYAYTQANEAVYGEDTHAHGSHTASTTAGNFLDVDYYGNALTISGMAPHANIIAYDVCYEDGCPNAASLAAVQQAILDGVDVLNYSIGPNSAVNPYENPVELAMLDAMHAGILTATSAGNSGPGLPQCIRLHLGQLWLPTAPMVAFSDILLRFTNPVVFHIKQLLYQVLEFLLPLMCWICQSVGLAMMVRIILKGVILSQQAISMEPSH